MRPTQTNSLLYAFSIYRYALQNIMQFQAPPALGNQYEDDSVLRSYLRRSIPSEVLGEIKPTLVEMGELAGGKLYQMQLADRLNEPKLTQWDAWGNRIDRIELTPLWRIAERVAAEHGVVATAYEQKHGRFSRVNQCALAYLFTPSTDIYSCPLAMTDGAARTLLSSGNRAQIERAVPHLTSRDPKEFWTSGQWMTELTGGSDVGASETIAKPDSDLTRNSELGTRNWLLYGR
jgi:acyl-CoA dehydrogenase